MKYRNKANGALIRHPASRRGFSLLEVLVAIAVFGLIVVSAAGVFSAVQLTWRKQRNALDLVQNTRWAMERITNELRQALYFQASYPVNVTGAGSRLRLENSAGDLIWYWRGDGASYGNTEAMYRGTGSTLSAANATRQELTNFIVDNPSGNALFTNATGGLYTIELTARPQPAQAAGRENSNYTLRTQVRPRN